jgi:hypothetical protein
VIDGSVHVLDGRDLTRRAVLDGFRQGVALAAQIVGEMAADHGQARERALCGASGGRGRDRTCDPLVRSQMLCPLSYATTKQSIAQATLLGYGLVPSPWSAPSVSAIVPVSPDEGLRPDQITTENDG